MAYLGNVPARSFISFERQVFTIVNSQTAYTLSHSVTNENDIRLVVNNIVQEPGSGKAYTASGTTLTLSAALVNGTDEMYCVFLGRAVGTVNAPAGSVGTSQLVDDAVTLAKMASGTDGNIISYDASGNPVAVATGSAGQILTSAGAGAPPTFATPAAAGKVLQAVSGTDNTQRSASSSNYSHGNSTAIATLTPSATSSKVLVIATTAVGKAGGSAAFSIFRDNSTNLATNQMLWHDMAANTGGADFSGAFLDSPNTTSEINYRIKWTNNTNNATYISYNNSLTSVIAIEIGA